MMSPVVTSSIVKTGGGVGGGLARTKEEQEQVLRPLQNKQLILLLQ